jgi:hypothetical protein
LAGLFVACFGGVIFGGQQFGFRDAAHFYYPLYQRVQEQWASGQLPLWEPGANGGMPLLGSAMAAVLYPGKVLFALFPYAWALRLYVLAHVAIAFGAMIALGRTLGLSSTGTWLAGVCYAFAGPVLSNYLNVIYLVGAAWAPLGFRAAYRWVQFGRRSGLVELAVVLAMQLLGGDPEAALVTVVCSTGYAVGVAGCHGRLAVRPRYWGAGFLVTAAVWAWLGPSLSLWIYGSDGPLGQMLVAAAAMLVLIAYVVSCRGTCRLRLITILIGLASSCILALTLAAIQVFPVIEQVIASKRWSATEPLHIYESSLLPYRFIEWIWPNVFGTFTHGNRYWMMLLPPAGAQRPWPLSLYIGALPFVLALSTAGVRNGPPWRAWMTTIALLTLWASLGEFAAPTGWRREAPSLSTGDDSFYGLLTTVLPGFRLFRLPYKLLVFTSLALASLAGLGWDRLSGAGWRGVVRLTSVLCLVSTLAMVLAVWQRDKLVAAMARAPDSSHPVFGPLDAGGAVADLLDALRHGSLALGSSVVLILMSSRWPRFIGLLVVPLVALDIALANARLVMTIPQSDFERESEVASAISAAECAAPGMGPFRVHRLASWVPLGWSRTSSQSRLREIVNWEIDTLQPLFGLSRGMNYVLADESETGRAGYSRLFEPVARRVDARTALALGVETGRPVLYHPRQAFDVWGTRYFILPSFPDGWTSPNRSYASFLDQTELIYPDPARVEGPDHKEDRVRWLEAKDVQVRRNKAAFPRAWIVHEARIIRPLDSHHKRARTALFARLGFREHPDGAETPLPSPDLRTIAYVESGENDGLTTYLPGGRQGPGEHVSVELKSPTQVTLSAQLERPGLVVLADAFDAGWQLEIDGRPARTLRANFSMRAAAVPAGSHRLVYVYRPVSLHAGAVCSLLGVLIVTASVLWRRSRADASSVRL